MSVHTSARDGQHLDEPSFVHTPTNGWWLRAISRADLSARARAVAFVIASSMGGPDGNVGDADPKRRPGMRRIAEWAGVSDGHVHKYVQEVVDAGWVRIVEHGGRGRPHRYELALPVGSEAEAAWVEHLRERAEAARAAARRREAAKRDRKVAPTAPPRAKVNACPRPGDGVPASKRQGRTTPRTPQANGPGRAPRRGVEGGMDAVRRQDVHAVFDELAHRITMLNREALTGRSLAVQRAALAVAELLDADWRVDEIVRAVVSHPLGWPDAVQHPAGLLRSKVADLADTEPPHVAEDRQRAEAARQEAEKRREQEAEEARWAAQRRAEAQRDAWLAALDDDERERWWDELEASVDGFIAQQVRRQRRDNDARVPFLCAMYVRPTAEAVGLDTTDLPADEATDADTVGDADRDRDGDVRRPPCPAR